MQYVCLLPKYVKYIFWGAAVCISHILDTSIFNPFADSGAFKFLSYSGRPFEEYKSKMWVVFFFCIKANRIHDSFLKEILAYIS